MTKNLLFILATITLVSCGSSKQITQNSTPLTEEVVAVIEAPKEPEFPYVVEEEVIVEEVVEEPEKIYSTEVPPMADKVIWTAVTYKGTPYKYGGTSKSGMDCSGLVYTSFKKRKLDLPRSSSMMNERGYVIPLKYARRGDLLFFKTSGKKSKGVVNHVGIVTSAENGEVNFIHATSSKGVIVSKLSEPYWNKSFVEVKRVID